MDLIQQLDGLRGLSSRRLDGLCEVPGIGPGKASPNEGGDRPGGSEPWPSPFRQGPESDLASTRLRLLSDASEPAL